MMTRLFAVISLFVLFFASVPAARADHRSGGAVDCQSHDFAVTRCDVPWHDARIVRQLSHTRCVRGQNWDIDQDGLWVDGGCGGRFVAVEQRGRGRGRGHGYSSAGDQGGGWQPDSSWDQRFAIRCASHDYEYNFCGVDLGGGGRASLEQQTSGTPCVEGQTWGSNRAGIWVVQGCAGVFTIDRRWR